MKLRRHFLLLASLMALVTSPSFRRADAEPKGPPPGGTPVIADALGAFKPVGLRESDIGVVTAESQPFRKAIRAHVPVKAADVWSVQLVAPTSSAVAKGDVMLATFWLRNASEGSGAALSEARVQAVFERAANPYEKSLEYDASAGPTWEQFEVPFTASEAYAAGGAQFNFRVGLAAQTVEIGGVQVLNFGKAVKLRDLPMTRRPYVGESPDAPWRKAAEQRIEQLRKGDLTVTVVDAAGKPIVGATVEVRMQRHAFGFGSAVASDELLEQSPDAERYRQTIKDLYNRVTIENHLKWGQWQSDRATGLKSVAWLRGQGIEVRGHNLVWPSARNTPHQVMALKGRPDALRKAVADHIVDEVSALRGQLVEWDVINEPYDNHDIQDILGRSVMVDWFKLAKQTDPGPRLFLNDYPTLQPLSSGDGHLLAFADNIKFLKEHGAPIEGIGFQCHYGHSFTPPEQILRGLDDFAKFGLPIEITEFDMNAIDEQLQADAMRDMLTLAFSHPSVNGVIMWGFWAGRHWEPDAALYAKDWTIRPNGQVWVDLVKKRWWTNVDGKSGADAAFATRGFLGDYKIAVRANGKEKSVEGKLVKSGTGLRVVLD